MMSEGVHVHDMAKFYSNLINILLLLLSFLLFYLELPEVLV